LNKQIRDIDELYYWAGDEQGAPIKPTNIIKRTPLSRVLSTILPKLEPSAHYQKLEEEIKKVEKEIKTLSDKSKQIDIIITRVKKIGPGEEAVLSQEEIALLKGEDVVLEKVSYNDLWKIEFLKSKLNDGVQDRRMYQKKVKDFQENLSNAERYAL
jgi:hypothetical protein